MKYLPMTLAWALLTFSTGAQACELSASTSGGGLQAVYDPFAPQNTVVDLRVSVTNSGDEACLGRFYIAPLDGQLNMTAGGQYLAYRIEGANSGALPNEFGPFNVNVPAGGSEKFSIRFTVQAQQIVPVGLYTGRLTLRGETAANEPVPVGGAIPIVTMAVPARSEISISGAPSPSLTSIGMAPATINFPNAQTGQTGRVFINVWANSSVQVRLTSENGGIMRNLQSPSLTPLSYSATFDGNALSLANVQTLNRTPPMSILGASYELAITLGDTTHNFAGRYRDRITVDVDAN
ncbi:MAG: hypothetical protein JNM03_02560 [Sphingopyxis sp.]|jgi:hypothetical protein|uniref:hypothetical protein n=1 Tax=Sphingopyxis sp. TaxID=1908224 RepID=UPI001A39D3AB|nr:hypothetical protein [Sphingopyxis sp.]MBL9068856.1 hypothetical protein [Sphingopyxis sp.]